MGLIPIFDAGHGGLINGKYQCLAGGRQSPNWEKGIYYEGVGNRDFIHNIKSKIRKANVPYFDTGISEEDRPLKSRVYNANKIYSKNKNTYLLSIHSNGGGGTGYEGFTSIGRTKSDDVMEEFLTDIENAFPDEKMRYDLIDGDKDKERNYYILKNTYCPALLLELLFMDYKPDYFKLFDCNYREKLTTTIANTIIKLHNR